MEVDGNKLTFHHIGVSERISSMVVAEPYSSLRKHY